MGRDAACSVGLARSITLVVMTTNDRADGRHLAPTSFEKSSRRTVATVRRAAVVAPLTALVLLATACTVPDPTVPVPTVPTAAPTTVPTTAPTSPPASPSTRVLPDVHLPGLNDPECRSDDRPVVLLPGTFSTVAGNFAPLATALQAAGRCVFGTNYGLAGVAPIRDSATTVADFVDSVLEVTGADQVDVVAFSQGGLVLRTALRLQGLAPRVGTAVMIAPTFHGTTSTLLDDVPPVTCPACADQTAGSALLTELDAGGDLDGQVRYATISSRDDTVVTPVDTQSPAGPPDRVRSLIVQDACPGTHLEHLQMPGNAAVIAWVVQAVRTGGQPDPSSFPCG